MVLQPGAQAGVAAIDLIGGHPPSRHLGVQGTLEHGLGQLRLGLEVDLLGDVRLGAAIDVAGPFLGQVQLPVHQRPALVAGVGQEDPDLAVLDPPGRARVLALHPGRLGALLEEPGLIHHQHPGRVAEPLHDIAAHVVAQRVRVPAGGGQQPLHSVRGRLPGVLGQLPAILAVDPTQQPTQEPSSPPADLRPGEPGADPLAQPLELRRPALDLGQHALPPPPSAQQKARNLPHAKCGCSTRWLLVSGIHR
jgi:hypothetical protein